MRRVMWLTVVLALTLHGQSTPVELPADCSAYASIPLPTEAARAPVPKSPPGCASYRSYRGIGRPRNYAEARACAWQERLAQKADLGQHREQLLAWVVGGSLILADIYINGAGVKRDIPLAMRFACESEKRLAELALPDVVKFRDSRRPQVPFEFCDYAATTFTMNFCRSYDSEIEDDRRSRFFLSLESKMTADEQVAFRKLLAAQDAYLHAHAREVDQRGSIRGLRTAGSQGILKDQFRADVVRFERKSWPTLSASQTTSADALLEREFANTLRRSRRQTNAAVEQGAVSADNLTAVEEAWQNYRDCWVDFARLRYPDAVALIRAKITLDRIRLLKTIQ